MRLDHLLSKEHAQSVVRRIVRLLVDLPQVGSNDIYTRALLGCDIDGAASYERSSRRLSQRECWTVTRPLTYEIEAAGAFSSAG